jgi:spore germination cell wall hydrolase CwlJ-like protein
MRISSRLLLLPAALTAATTLSGCFSLFGWGQMSERECLTRAMYFESNRSSEEGMMAVGTVVMNRVADNRYPKSVCGVVGQPRQFADGVLSKPMKEGRSLALADNVAARVLSGARHPGVGTAQFFHTVGYSFPYDNMYYVVQAGGNIFYEKRPGGKFLPPPPTLIASQQPQIQAPPPFRQPQPDPMAPFVPPPPAYGDNGGVLSFYPAVGASY